METQLPPPPPPPQPRKTGLIVGIVAGLLALCLCVSVVAGVIAFREQIPIISSFFPTPTPDGIPYVSADLGLQIVYPYNWYLYDDEAGLLVIATSEAAVAADTLSPSDGFAAVIRDVDVNAGMYYGLDITSAEDMLDSLLDQGTMNLTDLTQIDRQDGLTIGGYPAARVIYTYLGDSFRQANYIVTILSGDVPTTVLFTTSEEYLGLYRPAFDSILDSLTFTD